MSLDIKITVIFICVQRQVTLHTYESTVLEFRAATSFFVRIPKWVIATVFYSLLNDAVSNSRLYDYGVEWLDDSEWWIGSDMWGSGPGLILGAMRTFVNYGTSEDSPCSGRDSDRGLLNSQKCYRFKKHAWCSGFHVGLWNWLCHVLIFPRRGSEQTFPSYVLSDQALYAFSDVYFVKVRVKWPMCLSTMPWNV
jgi:hypothetical protein